MKTNQQELELLAEWLGIEHTGKLSSDGTGLLRQVENGFHDQGIRLSRMCVPWPSGQFPDPAPGVSPDVTGERIESPETGLPAGFCIWVT